MLFEDDTSLLSFFERHKDDEDDTDLKAAVLKYVGAGATGKTPIEEQNTTGDSIEGVSSIVFRENSNCLIILVLF